MRIGVSQGISAGIVVGLCAVALIGAQEPPAGRGGGPGQGQGRGGGAAPAPAVAQVARSPVVDQAAHDRGRALWASHCIDCHGSQARGSDTGPNIIRTKVVNFDRSAVAGGQRPRTVSEGRSPDAEPEAERVVHRRGGRRAGQLPPPARQRHDARHRRSSRSATSSSATPRPARPTSTAKAACATCHNATERNLAGIVDADSRTRSICSSACSSRWAAAGDAAAADVGPACRRR